MTILFPRALRRHLLLFAAPGFRLVVKCMAISTAINFAINMTISMAICVGLGASDARAAIVGHVRNAESHLPVRDALVVLGELERGARTDSLGRYELKDVPPGPQHLRVSRVGYAPRTLHALVPRTGALELNVDLEPRPFRVEPIEVHAPLAARGLEPSEGVEFPDRTTSIAAVRNHPQSIEPDVFSALSGGEVVERAESPNGLHVRGGASDHVAYTVDGTPIFNPYHSAGLFSAWNPDAIARLTLSSAMPSPSEPEALSGSVSAVTRTPSAQLRAAGSVSSTQARATVDGLIGSTPIGFLLSWRQGFPGLLFSKREASHVRGESGDALAKLESPLFGGRLRVLGYESVNDLSTATRADSAGIVSPRNVFEWYSQSTGGEWRREGTTDAFELRVWNARGRSDSNWQAPGTWLDLSATRRDFGALAGVERRGTRSGKPTSSRAGIEFTESRTRYEVLSDTLTRPLFRLSSRDLLTSGFLETDRPLAADLITKAAASVEVLDGTAYFSPRMQLAWRRPGPFAVSVSAGRLHQFAQSLKNSESVVGNIFPADLFVGAGASGVPVARSDQGLIAVDYHPLPGLRVGVQGYTRALEGLVLVAVGEGMPFATREFPTGAARTRGIAVEATMSGSRLSVLASYGTQRVRYRTASSSFVPEYGAGHLVEAGCTFFPTPETSLRVGAAGGWSRRSTPFAGGIEWEACNLRDRGCEFIGSPVYNEAALGSLKLPAYFRVDAGARRHWHVHIADRDLELGLFASVTNLFGQKNILTYAIDLETGERVGIEMRPRAPFVAGLEWRL